MTGHIVKRMAVATSEDGGPEGQPIQVDKSWWRVGRSHWPNGSEGTTPEQYLLHQMTMLCQTVESLKRQVDCNRMEQTMTTKMEDGFKGEQKWPDNMLKMRSSRW